MEITRPTFMLKRKMLCVMLLKRESSNFSMEKACTTRLPLMASCMVLESRARFSWLCQEYFLVFLPRKLVIQPTSGPKTRQREEEQGIDVEYEEHQGDERENLPDEVRQVAGNVPGTGRRRSLPGS